jgi:hypothetical protein
MCYQRCRSRFPCDRSSRGSCMTTCDRTLGREAELFASQFGSPLTWWMNNNNSPDPGPNDCSCR